MGDRNLLKEAVADAKQVRDLAVSAAKKKLVEEMQPAIRNLVEREIKSSLDQEGVNRMRRVNQGYPGESQGTWEEGLDFGEGDLEMDDEKEFESIDSMFPGISEMGDLDEPEEEIPDLGESKDTDEDDLEEGCKGEEEEMDEEITVDEKALKQAYEELMRVNSALSEAQVSSGFADNYKATEWETEDSPPSKKGLMDKGSENKGWEETEPPAKQDYSVKEAIEKGLRENKPLRDYVRFLESHIEKQNGVVETLKRQVSETHLFNTKVLHVNEMLNKFGKGLTNEQKKIVIEKIDKAKTIREVKMVAEAFKASFGSTGKISESRKRQTKANASKRMTSGSPDQKVLRESVDKTGLREQFARQRELAGLLK